MWIKEKENAPCVSRFGIRCNCVLPGFISTPMTDKVPGKVINKVQQQHTLSWVTLYHIKMRLKLIYSRLQLSFCICVNSLSCISHLMLHPINLFFFMSCWVFCVFQMMSLVPLGRMGEPAGQWMQHLMSLCIVCSCNTFLVLVFRCLQKSQMFVRFWPQTTPGTSQEPASK